MNERWYMFNCSTFGLGTKVREQCGKAWIDKGEMFKLDPRIAALLDGHVKECDENGELI